ncbi:hypothetical protein PIB30_012229 [Stylosanthes scabra]|uniref:Pentatricopeptide repeat-containing protein n=1 Tax=Stylosanthes scabra TaxID=79078 RepID=A0ABU6V4C0_9FABA|nr:hypothetical protein [Stylosanthes scabra]
MLFAIILSLVGFAKLEILVELRSISQRCNWVELTALMQPMSILLRDIVVLGMLIQLFLYIMMCSRGFRPCASILDMMVVLLCDNCRVDEAVEFIGNAVCRYDLVPKKKSYEVLIKGLCSEGKMEKALKVQAEMVGIGHHQPNLEIYSAFIDGYTRQGNEVMAEVLRKEMVQT